MLMSMQASQFGRVALLLGGWSAEREISLNSGAAVLAAMQRQGIDVEAIDAGRDVIQQLSNGNFDRVFIMLHGRGGEDGVIQGALELINMPYTGSGVMASALCMDKLMTKRLWMGVGLPTPKHRLIEQDTDLDKVIDELGLPLIVKPATEGSSIGMSKVDSAEQLPAAVAEAAACDCAVFVEQWITGEEFTVSILNGRALPMIRLRTPKAFYNYEAKYQSNDTEYLCPCGLPEEKEQALQAVALKAFEASGAEGWGRVDMMLDDQGQPWLIEINTVPGMTDHSLVPMAAKEAGIDFDSLVLEILSTSLENEGA
jgi:D-alanine-D-alanine ligase